MDTDSSVTLARLLRGNVREISQLVNNFPSHLPLLNDDFKPDLTTRPITLIDAVLPPLLFYLALTLLFPSPSARTPLIRVLRTSLALTSAYLFLALPYRFHVPGSAIFSYQLGLVGWYGGPRVLDLLLFSRNPPKRIKHVDGRALSQPETTSFTERRRIVFARDVDHSSGIKSGDFEEVPVEQSVASRLTWAFDLMIAMRGAGWDFASTDCRHSTRSWHPPPADRIYALCTYILPTLVGSISVMKHIFNAIEKHAQTMDAAVVAKDGMSLMWLPVPLRMIAVASTGITLYALFDASYTIAAIFLGITHYYRQDLTDPSSVNNIASMPPLNPLPASSATSIRNFWSRAWHRLFARLFLVWGVWPGQFIEQIVASWCRLETRGDVGKVIGAFAVSAVVHGQGERAALGERSSSLYNRYGAMWPLGGEPLFFMLSALGIIIETAFRERVLAYRKRNLPADHKAESLVRWYDQAAGSLWTVSWLLWTGQYFVEGWVRSGIFAELTFSNVRWNV